MDQAHLIYFADPMCSWCWGFSPVIESIATEFGDALPIRLVLGGLRPGTVAPLDAQARADMRGHWEHVHAASAQPFDWSFFERPRFVYDTEPASRAVVVLRRQGEVAALRAMRSIQRAFYAHNADVTDPEVLTRIAVDLGADAERFRLDWESAPARAETRRDFDLAHASGIRGFPTLIAASGTSGPFSLITHGYQPAADVIAQLHRWLAQHQPSHAHAHA